MRNVRGAVQGILAAATVALTAACGAAPSGAPAAPRSTSTPPPSETPTPAPAAVAIPTCGPVTVPPFNAANFSDSTKIDNKWFPLVPGTQFVMEGHANRGGGVLPHQIVFTVTDLTKVINGVRTVVLWDVDTNHGVLAESELAFFAQDRNGNVWTLGEYPEEFTNGTFSGAPSTWFSGIAHADAGVQVRAAPHVDSTEYLQGVGPEVNFLDCAKDVQTDQRTCVPTGCYQGVAVVDERGGLDPTSGIQRKYYAPGVGGIQIEAVGDPEGETLMLAKLVTPNPATLDTARRGALNLEKHGYQVSAAYRQTAPITVP